MKAKLTTLQYVLTIHGTQMGVGILILPHKLAEQSGSDSWISIILAWLVSTTMSLVIIRIMKNNPAARS